MACLVYALLKSEGLEFPELPGLDNKPIRFAAKAGFAAAYSSLERRIEPAVEYLLRFEEVVEALFASRPVIPVRFGNYFKTPEMLEEFLEENSEELAKLLEGLSGKMEMGIRILTRRHVPRQSLRAHEAQANSSGALPAGATPVPGGKDYLAVRKNYYYARNSLSGRTEDFSRILQILFQGLYMDVKFEEQTTRAQTAVPEQPGAESEWTLFLSAYFLVPTHLVGDFSRRFSELTHEDAKFLLSGPWPPYSFATMQVRQT